VKRGDLVRLRADGGEIVRRVVDVDADGVAICRDDEYEAAQREGRAPTVAFFKLEYVVGKVDAPRSQRA
jgi:hypothetical protein